MVQLVVSSHDLRRDEGTQARPNSDIGVHHGSECVVRNFNLVRYPQRDKESLLLRGCEVVSRACETPCRAGRWNPKFVSTRISFFVIKVAYLQLFAFR